MSGNYLESDIIINKTGNVVTITYVGGWLGGTPKGNLGVIFTLPEEYRPQNQIITFTGPYLSIQISVDKYGNLMAYNYSDPIEEVSSGKFFMTYVTS